MPNSLPLGPPWRTTACTCMKPGTTIPPSSSRMPNAWLSSRPMTISRSNRSRGSSPAFSFNVFSTRLAGLPSACLMSNTAPMKPVPRTLPSVRLEFSTASGLGRKFSATTISGVCSWSSPIESICMVSVRLYEGLESECASGAAAVGDDAAAGGIAVSSASPTAGGGDSSGWAATSGCARRPLTSSCAADSAIAVLQVRASGRPG
mmetsp:Transcript_15154/g.39009  ORF Transcript_15154/g.39009 Transcript_15154/m.39009 type:complete len:205 (+) Transcript_15154:1147-1761(+)